VIAWTSNRGRFSAFISRRSLALAAVSIVPSVGCFRPEQRVRLAALPPGDAAAIVSRNAARITATMRATGSVDGQLTEEGRRRRFSLDGSLLFRAPRFVRFDLKKLGDRQLLLGSNLEAFWCFTKDQDRFTCGRHGDDGTFDEELGLRPDQFVEALGLTALPMPNDTNVRVMHRVSGEFQHIALARVRDGSAPQIEREYWLDRAAPRLVRRVIFRDESGKVEFAAHLDDYRQIAEDGPWAPRELTVIWPKSDARLRFQVNKWTLLPEITEDGPQFATPPECSR
jgi:hypothetical protein